MIFAIARTQTMRIVRAGNSLRTLTLSNSKVSSTLPTPYWMEAHFVNIKASMSTGTLQSTQSSSTATRQITDKNIFQKLWSQYSFSGQRDRILRGERLFRAAQFQASNSSWFFQGRIPNEFRPRHAVLVMHVWFLHKRLVSDKEDSHTSLLVQEELFDILWYDTKTRIRAAGVNELMVNKHLKDIQNSTFLHCTHYDHAFSFDDPVKRREELALAIWTHVLMESENAYNDQLNRMALYVEWQYHNIMADLPTSYFEEGRINWGNIPDFSLMKDNEGNLLDELDPPKELPPGWLSNLTESGDIYYWNEDTMQSTWEKPS